MPVWEGGPMISRDVKTYQEEQKRIKDEIERRHGKTTEQLYAEREKRTRDATELKEPDRAPLSLNADPSNYTGVQRSAAYYDPIGWKRAVRDFTVAFEPDHCNAGLPTSGAALETLGVTNRLWPGGPLPPDYEYQIEEMEFMKEDEYDLFFSDPTDFMLRRYLPRMYSALSPFAKLPPLSLIGSGFEGLTTLLATPEFEKAARDIAKAGKQMRKFRNTIGDSYGDLAYLGFPPFTQLGIGGIGGAPFDTVSSHFRGMKGSMTDMYRRPEKLLRACDMILDWRIAHAIPARPEQRGKRIGMPLWRGDKKFMSDRQFEKFYWPGLKRALQAVIDLGYVPVPFFEAEFGDRLERLLELPKGKIIASVEDVDTAKAREILKGHTCVLARGPFSLKLASPNTVVEYYKEIFDRFGRGGGLLLNIRMPDRGNPEDIKPMVESIREYCRY
jgi:hypothetical protein